MADLPRDLLLLALSALVNGAVTWGVVKTQLVWLRRDVDELRAHVFPASRPNNGRA